MSIVTEKRYMIITNVSTNLCYGDIVNGYDAMKGGNVVVWKEGETPQIIPKDYVKDLYPEELGSNPKEFVLKTFELKDLIDRVLSIKEFKNEESSVIIAYDIDSHEMFVLDVKI